MKYTIFNFLLSLFTILICINSSYANGGDGSKNKDLCVRNAISPNGDAINKYFIIEGITKLENRNNEVHIYNRWGVEVFSTKGYDGDIDNLNPERAFAGISTGRATLSTNQQLPTGTYFYTLIITTTGGGEKSQAGYLYIN